jgi:hypothetical protein
VRHARGQKSLRGLGTPQADKELWSQHELTVCGLESLLCSSRCCERTPLFLKALLLRSCSSALLRDGTCIVCAIFDYGGVHFTSHEPAVRLHRTMSLSWVQGPLNPHYIAYMRDAHFRPHLARHVARHLARHLARHVVTGCLAEISYAIQRKKHGGVCAWVQQRPQSSPRRVHLPSQDPFLGPYQEPAQRATETLWAEPNPLLGDRRCQLVGVRFWAQMVRQWRSRELLGRGSTPGRALVVFNRCFRPY